MTKSLQLVVIAFVSAAAFAATAFMGEPLPSGEHGEYVLHKLRLPRATFSFLAGSALGVSGMAFQALFRNALATPFTLGVATGAHLGAAIAIRLGVGLSVLGGSAVSSCAFAGALGAIVLIKALAWSRRRSGSANLLLTGIALNYFFTSLILFLQYTSSLQDRVSMLHWLMGDLNVVGFRKVWFVLPCTIVGVSILGCLSKELNLLSIDDELAVSRGVNTRRSERIILLTSALLVGAVVAVAGPIAFVGLITPHIMRLVVGPDHRHLAPATALFGGAFLCICDLVARSFSAHDVMPVNIVTAFLGGAFFLFLLLRRPSASRT